MMPRNDFATDDFASFDSDAKPAEEWQNHGGQNHQVASSNSTGGDFLGMSGRPG
jgi:hypothetical protein